MTRIRVNEGLQWERGDTRSLQEGQVGHSMCWLRVIEERVLRYYNRGYAIHVGLEHVRYIV